MGFEARWVFIGQGIETLCCLTEAPSPNVGGTGKEAWYFLYALEGSPALSEGLRQALTGSQSQFALNKRVLDPRNVISHGQPFEEDLSLSWVNCCRLRRVCAGPARPGVAERNQPFHEACSLCKAQINSCL